MWIHECERHRGEREDKHKKRAAKRISARSGKIHARSLLLPRKMPKRQETQNHSTVYYSNKEKAHSPRRLEPSKAIRPPKSLRLYFSRRRTMSPENFVVIYTKISVRVCCVHRKQIDSLWQFFSGTTRKFVQRVPMYPASSKTWVKLQAEGKGSCFGRLLRQRRPA
jgi:hypothetical protein